MTKYVYKMDYNNADFIANMEKYVGKVTKAECSSDCLLVIEADVSIKKDLDEYMKQNGFVYLLETSKTITASVNWGILETVDLPSQDINVGDHAYCATTKKPLWWDGAKWVDALGN